MGEPARNYSWRKAWAGNDLALKHGSYSPERWRPVAEALVAELAVSAPWTARPAHEAAVWAWARVEAQARLVANWLDRVGLLDEKGKPRPATVLLDRLESRAGKLRAELGISPMGHARLLVAVAAVVRSRPGEAGLDEVLVELAEEGRRALEAGRAGESGEEMGDE